MRSLLLAILFVSCATAPLSLPDPVVPPIEPAKTVEPATAGTPRPLPTLPPMKLVVLPTVGTPIVSVRFVFHVGSVDDPQGKEGLTALTTTMLTEGGTRSLTSAELNAALFPMAGEIVSDTDKEFTVIAGRVHTERFDRFLSILTETLLAPRLEAKEFERLKTKQLNVIRNRLRGENDEELGKVMLDALLFEGHPYRHAVVGTETGLANITLDDVAAHWKRCFTKARLVVGVAGAVDDALGARILASLGALPETGAIPTEIPTPPKVTNQTLIIRRDTQSTAGSFGSAWPLRRDEPDFALLFLGLSFLGEHRQEHGVLFRELRGRRGLNYGTYAYAEHYRQLGGDSIPRPNIARTAQDVTLWLRPVEAQHGVFATRSVLYFLNQALHAPLPVDHFETAKGFLTGATRIWTLTDQTRLGWAIDELIYGTPGFLEGIRAAISTATPETVQRALQKHFDPKALNFVFVTKDVDALRTGLLSPEPSPITYATPKPTEVTDEDKRIERHPLPMVNDRLRVIDAAAVMK
jgi:zinc protease